MDQLRTTLDEIERVLESERLALRVLDLSGIEQASEKKRELERRLRDSAFNLALSGDDRDRIRRVRETALANQLLLVHARACVRGALSLATGRPVDPYTSASSTSPGPLRLNVKG